MLRVFSLCGRNTFSRKTQALVSDYYIRLLSGPVEHFQSHVTADEVFWVAFFKRSDAFLSPAVSPHPLCLSLPPL